MAQTRERITKDTTVSTKELAVVLSLTVRRIQQLVQDGTFDPVSRGKYSLSDCVERYIRSITKSKGSELDEQREDAEVRIKKSKAIIASLEAKELQGKMHRSEDVAAMTEDLIYTIRSMLLALPGRLAVDVADVDTAAEAAEIIRKEIFTVMQELTNYRYDPEKYEARVRERRNWEIENPPDDDEE